MITCAYCGGAVAADATLCPSCGGPTKNSVGVAGDQPYFGDQKPSVCPICSVPVSAGDIICVQCGANLITGQQTVKQPEPEKTNLLPGIVKGLQIVGLVVIAAVCGVVLFMAATHLLRDPVGTARRTAQDGDLEYAAELLQNHLQRTPQDMDAQFLLGKVYWQGQRYDRAWEVFESVARQGGPHDREAAILALLATERLPSDANRQRQIALLRSIVQQRYPDDAELLKLLALLQGVEGEYRGQRDTMETLAARDDVLPPGLPGLARALANDLDGAEQSLRRAADAYPEEDAVIIALGFVHNLRGQDAVAIAALEQGIAAAAQPMPQAKLQLGALLMQRGQFGKALPLLTDAKNANPDDARSVFLHALCLQQNKLLDEALVAFENLATGTSEYAGVAALQMASVYTEQGNYDRAASFARRASEAGVATARQATIQGRVYAMQGDMIQAEQAYRRAISISGEYPAARLELGLLLINRGAIEEGLAELEQYLGLAERNPVQYRVNEIEVLVNQIKQAGR